MLRGISATGDGRPPHMRPVTWEGGRPRPPRSTSIGMSVPRVALCLAQKKGALGALFNELQLFTLIRESVVFGITGSVRVLTLLILLLGLAINTELRNGTSHKASY